MENLVLASRSPRRREILEKVGIPYVACAVDVDETIGSTRSVRSAVIDIASRKAEAALLRYSRGLVLGVDTVVVFSGRVLGKPSDAGEAGRFLRMLSGNRHFVYSGVALRDAGSGARLNSCSVTEVFFEKLSDDDIAGYLELGEWSDKAGGYAVQGRSALFVRRIVGSFYNVMGLPLEELYRMLRRFGYFEDEGRYTPVRRP